MSDAPDCRVGGNTRIAVWRDLRTGLLVRDRPAAAVRLVRRAGLDHEAHVVTCFLAGIATAGRAWRLEAQRHVFVAQFLIVAVVIIGNARRDSRSGALGEVPAAARRTVIRASAGGAEVGCDRIAAVVGAVDQVDALLDRVR